MGSYDVEFLTDDFERWNRFVERSPTGTVFQTSHWLRAVAGEVEVCAVKKGQELVGGFPITRNRKYGVNVLGQPSLTPYSGIVFTDMGERKHVSAVSARKSVGESVAEELKGEFDRVHVYTTPGVQRNLLPFKWEGYSFRVKHTYLLDVSDLDAVWDGMDGNRRNDIRKAEEDGVYVDVTDDVDAALELVEKTFERQDESFGNGGTARRVNAELAPRDQARAFVARDADDRPIAASYVVWDDDRAHYLLGGYDSENGHHGATALALWESMQYVREEAGVTVFDFEGSEIPSIERFFRKFGGEVVPYYGLVWSTRWLRPIVALR
jgi:hypothetical protein